MEFKKPIRNVNIGNKLIGRVRPVMVPKGNKVAELNGHPVKVWTWAQHRAWKNGGPGPFD
jgi:hypothetical protein